MVHFPSSIYAPTVMIQAAGRRGYCPPDQPIKAALRWIARLLPDIASYLTQIDELQTKVDAQKLSNESELRRLERPAMSRSRDAFENETIERVREISLNTNILEQNLQKVRTTLTDIRDQLTKLNDYINQHKKLPEDEPCPDFAKLIKNVAAAGSQIRSLNRNAQKLYISPTPDDTDSDIQVSRQTQERTNQSIKTTNAALITVITILTAAAAALAL